MNPVAERSGKGNVPVDAIVLKVSQRSARVRILGKDGQVTFRSGDVWEVIPGHLVTLAIDRRWAVARRRVCEWPDRGPTSTWRSSGASRPPVSTLAKDRSPPSISTERALTGAYAETATPCSSRASSSAAAVSAGRLNDRPSAAMCEKKLGLWISTMFFSTQ